MESDFSLLMTAEARTARAADLELEVLDLRRGIFQGLQVRRLEG